MNQLGHDRERHAATRTPSRRGGSRREQRQQGANSLATRTKQRLGCRPKVVGTRTRRGDEQMLQAGQSLGRCRDREKLRSGGMRFRPCRCLDEVGEPG
jgi:hypothetical protein